MKNQLKQVIKEFENLVNVVEKNEIYKSLIGEIPETIISIYPVDIQMKFKSLYADMRLDGNTKQKSLDLSARMVLREVKNNTMVPLLAEIQKTLLRIKKKIVKGEYYQDSEMNEFEDLREEIPVLENFNDFNKKDKKDKEEEKK